MMMENAPFPRAESVHGLQLMSPMDSIAERVLSLPSSSRLIELNMQALSDASGLEVRQLGNHDGVRGYSKAWGLWVGW